MRSPLEEEEEKKLLQELMLDNGREEISWGAGLFKLDLEAGLTVELRIDSGSSNVSGSVSVLSFDELEQKEEDSCNEEEEEELAMPGWLDLASLVVAELIISAAGTVGFSTEFKFKFVAGVGSLGALWTSVEAGGGIGEVKLVTGAVSCIGKMLFTLWCLGPDFDWRLSSSSICQTLVPLTHLLLFFLYVTLPL